MDTQQRLNIYGTMDRMTARQRRRTIKEGRNRPERPRPARRGHGLLSSALQGFRELAQVRRAA